MSTISPGEFLSVLGAADPETLVEQNLAIATRQIWKREPTFENGVATTIKGPPTSGDRLLNEFWRDALGAEYVCISAGTPGTWKQIRPALVASNPSGVPTGYWIIRYDLTFAAYHYDGAAWQPVSSPKNTWDATSAPTVDDDVDLGYAVGSRWIDVTGAKEYVCLDATDGAAVWIETTAGAGAGEANTASNVGSGGLGLFKQKAGVDLEFLNLIAGLGITLTATGSDEVEIKSSDDARLLAIPMLIDDGTATIATGQKRPIEIPFGCDVVGWTVLGDASGSCEVKINRCTYSGYPTFAEISASGERPALSSAQKNQDLTLTTWASTAIAAGDVLIPEVVSSSGLAWVLISLRVRRNT